LHVSYTLQDVKAATPSALSGESQAINLYNYGNLQVRKGAKRSAPPLKPHRSWVGTAIGRERERLELPQCGG